MRPAYAGVRRACGGHAARIRAQALASGRPVREDEPRLLLGRLPGRTERGSQRALPPELHRALPPAPTLSHEATAGDPPLRPASAWWLTRVRSRQPKKILPAALPTERDQGMRDQPAIRQQRAVGGSPVREDLVEQRADH